MADALCFSSSSPPPHNFKTNPNFQLLTCIILHDLSLFCSLIISYPLYFSYFIFFSRYFIKLISFISPLFIATVLLSLLLTTTTTAKLPQLELGILQTVIQELKSNLDEVNGDEKERRFEDFEIYKIVFDGTLSIMICDEDLDELCVEKITENAVHSGRRNAGTISDSDVEKLGVEKVPESSVHGRRRNDDIISDSITEKLGFVKITENEKTPESSVHGGRRNYDTINDSTTGKLGFERITENEKTPETSVHGGRSNDDTVNDSTTEKLGFEKAPESSVAITESCVDESENENCVDKLLEELDRFEDFTTATETDSDSDEVTGELQTADAGPVRRVGSRSAGIESFDNDKQSQTSIRSSSWRSNSSRILNSQGSMKEEKEWRRTLACKLFEERFNSQGGEEGMDSLWEAYENDNSNNRREIMSNNNINGGIESFHDEDEDEDQDDEEEDMSSGHLCCLQALKLSTRKMNLGMGKPNLVKISKALKGFGWLHQVKNKHGKRS